MHKAVVHLTSGNLGSVAICAPTLLAEAVGRLAGMCAGISGFVSLWNMCSRFIFWLHLCCCSVGANLSMTSANFMKQSNKLFPWHGAITFYFLRYMSSTFEPAFYSTLVLCILWFLIQMPCASTLNVLQRLIYISADSFISQICSSGKI